MVQVPRPHALWGTNTRVNLHLQKKKCTAIQIQLDTFEEANRVEIRYGQIQGLAHEGSSEVARQT